MITIKQIIFKGTGGTESGRTVGTLLRTDGSEVLQLDTNERGGYSTYTAPPGKEIVFSNNDKPLVRIYGAGEMMLIGYSDGSVPYQRVFHRRDVSTNPIDQILEAQLDEIAELKAEVARLRGLK